MKYALGSCWPARIRLQPDSNDAGLLRLNTSESSTETVFESHANSAQLHLDRVYFVLWQGASLDRHDACSALVATRLVLPAAIVIGPAERWAVHLREPVHQGRNTAVGVAVNEAAMNQVYNLCTWRNCGWHGNALFKVKLTRAHDGMHSACAGLIAAPLIWQQPC